MTKLPSPPSKTKRARPTDQTMASKRDRNNDWAIKIENSSSLRTIVETVQHVVSRATFKIESKGDGYYLSVNTADVAYVSVIKVLLRLDSATLPTDSTEIKFCVDCKDLSFCINDLDPGHMVQLEGFGSSANPKVFVHTTDPDYPAYEEDNELKTYVDTDNVQLMNMQFDVIMDLEFPLLRRLLKKAVAIKAENMTLRVWVKDDMSRIDYCVNGEIKHRRAFCHPIKKSSDGSICCRAASDGGNQIFSVDGMDPIFEGTFCVEKISGFVKPLHTKMLHAVTKKEAGAPIMFEYPIGGEAESESKIFFLLAQVTDENEE